MKTAVVTITAGKLYTKIAEISHPHLKAYAKKIDAEFIVLSDYSKYSMPHYLKLELGELLKDFDRILYIDTDILVREDAPNIFDIIPDDKLGIFEEGQFMERQIGMVQFLSSEGINPAKWNKKYYNTGVMVLSKCHAPLFLRPNKEQDHFKEQSYLNLMIMTFELKIHNLHYKYNRMYLLDKITGEERFDSYFMHYAGLSEALPEETYLSLMKNDLVRWEKEKPAYKFQRNIAVLVEGGLGDQACAEPVIRYMRDVVYKGDNIIIASDFPELFRHTGLKVIKKGEAVVEAGKYHEIHTMRNPDHVSWEYMSHPYCHAADFASLQALRLMVPLKWKQIQLSYLDSELESVKTKAATDLKDAVLLHPGRGWNSKTFPPDVWESYLKTLTSSGYKVIVFGKRISKEQGVVEFNKTGAIDLTDQLSLGEMIALISQAKVLISNDSGPIHLAGAFDNWIGLIATCKKPDYVLPYRNGGNIYHKARSLEVEQLYYSYIERPTEVYGETIDKCTEEQMRRCLPPAENILKFVKECFDTDKRAELIEKYT